MNLNKSSPYYNIINDNEELRKQLENLYQEFLQHCVNRTILFLSDRFVEYKFLNLVGVKVDYIPFDKNWKTEFESQERRWQEIGFKINKINKNNKRKIEEHENIIPKKLKQSDIDVDSFNYFMHRRYPF